MESILRITSLVSSLFVHMIICICPHDNICICPNGKIYLSKLTKVSEDMSYSKVRREAIKARPLS